MTTPQPEDPRALIADAWAEELAHARAGLYLLNSILDEVFAETAKGLNELSEGFNEIVGTKRPSAAQKALLLTVQKAVVSLTHALALVATVKPEGEQHDTIVQRLLVELSTKRDPDEIAKHMKEGRAIAAKVYQEGYKQALTRTRGKESDA